MVATVWAVKPGYGLKWLGESLRNRSKRYHHPSPFEIEPRAALVPGLPKELVEWSPVHWSVAGLTC